MKYFFIIFFFLSAKSFAQDYKKFSNYYWYSQNSIVVDTTELQKGDTLFLGFGSGINKRFVFVQFRNLMLASAGGGFEPLTSIYSHGYLLIGDIKIKKAFGKEYPDVMLYINGTKMKAYCDLYNAIQSGEIVRTTGRKKVL